MLITIDNFILDHESTAKFGQAGAVEILVSQLSPLFSLDTFRLTLCLTTATTRLPGTLR
jgi:hypothetical protein